MHTHSHMHSHMHTHPHMHSHSHTHSHIHPTHAQMGKRKAAEEMDKERERRVDETEHISEEEAKRRMVIANKMIDVQKELLATHAPTKVSRWGCEEVWGIHTLTSSAFTPSHPHILYPHIPSIPHPHILHPYTLTPPFSHPHSSILTSSTLTSSAFTPSHPPPSHPHISHSSPLPPTQPILGVHSQKVLEEAKYYMQEQLLRKAAQKEALAAMDQEQQR